MGCLFKASDVARLCNVDIKTVHNWVNKEQVQAGRTPGRHLRFRPEVVRQLLEGMGVPVPSEVTEACVP